MPKKKAANKRRRPARGRTMRKKRTVRRAAKVPRSVAEVLEVISDPCGGPLVTTLDSSTPGQVTERVRATYGIAGGSDASNGYVVWFPSYHNSGHIAIDGAQTAKLNFSGNLYAFTNSNSSTTPTNNAGGVGAGAGTNTTATTGRFVNDPAHSLVAASSVFARAQTVSACLQMDYVGSLSALSGQVAVVSNYSLASFIRNSGALASSTTPVFPSVDEVFAYANRRERVPLSGAEVIWRPSEDSSIMRTNGSFSDGFALPNSMSTVVDACFFAGSGSSPTYPVAIDPNHVYGICIAWKGLPTSGGGVSFNCVKVVTAELAARNNQIEMIPRGLPAPKTAVTLNAALNYLDTEHSGWQQKLMNGLQSMSLGPTGNMAVATAAGGYAMASRTSAYRTLMSTITNGGAVWNARRSIMDSRA